jgi:hypothetical protein
MPDIWMDVDLAVIVPVNILPLLDNTDFKTVEEAIVYDSAGIAITWNFVTAAGVVTETAITPTTAGVYDWSEPLANKGMYAIEIPASGGASANNDTEGFGWITGTCTGVLPWRGPTIGFRAAGLNDKLIDSAYSATRGLAGTALPDAVADAAGGLAISDAGGLDIDAKLANTNEVTAARMGALTDWINGGRLDLILDIIAADTTTDIPALIGAPVVSLASDIAAIEAQTDDIGAAGAGLTAVPWNAAWDAEVQSEVNDVFTTAMTESYAADGAAATPAQALYMLLAFLQERSVAGTTLTVKKLDGATTAMTFTLNDATTPTAITRAG